MRSEQLYLTDIVEAAEAVERFVAGLDRDDFLQDELRQSAVIQKVLVIGEAAGHISQEMRNKYPQVVWSQIDCRHPSYFGAWLFWDRLGDCLAGSCRASTRTERANRRDSGARIWGLGFRPFSKTTPVSTPRFRSGAVIPNPKLAAGGVCLRLVTGQS